MHTSFTFALGCLALLKQSTVLAQPVDTLPPAAAATANAAAPPSPYDPAADQVEAIKKLDALIVPPSPEYERWKKAQSKWFPPVREEEKYFHESTWNNHYDKRYFDRILPEDVRKADLRSLVQTYLLFTAEARVESWLMHGTLLGWHWNKRILPWDSDVDVMVMENDMKFLASYHNMTIHEFEIPVNRTEDAVKALSSTSGVQIPLRRDSTKGEEEPPLDAQTTTRGYLLDINPAWENGSIADRANAIDARWIDTETGLYIDLTTLRTDPTSPDGPELVVKDRHHYLRTDIFPLRQETFEGVPALVPAMSSEVLAEEYGEKCLTMTFFSGHRFDKEKLLWLPLTFDFPFWGKGPRPDADLNSEHPA